MLPLFHNNHTSCLSTDLSTGASPTKSRTESSSTKNVYTLNRSSLLSIGEKIGAKTGKVINTNWAFINNFFVQILDSFLCSINPNLEIDV